MQVTVNKRVGTVMEWLPNGSVKDLLGSITAATMTLRAAVDAVAWARSSRTPVPPMPSHLADVRLAEVFTMPCNVPALQEIGGAVWVRCYTFLQFLGGWSVCSAPHVRPRAEWGARRQPCAPETCDGTS